MNPDDRPGVAPGTSDLVGQSRVVVRLWAALASGRVHHCYLFEGPRGVGKATVALRLAMAANCEQWGVLPPADLPCATCPTCRKIAEGHHPDVLEIGPDPSKASDVITVDQVREVTRQLSLHRHSARRRFVLVDPADRVRSEAAHALLKTLEEPPEGTGFILITSKAPSLLPTVRSRSQRVRFRAVPEEELRTWLARRGVTDAERLARLSLGSPGVALQIAGGRADEWDQMRAALLEALGGGVGVLVSWVEKTVAPPKEAADRRVEVLLAVLAGMLRDAACHGAGRPKRATDPDPDGVAAAWGRRLWPGGIRRLDDALTQARERLDLHVSNRLVLEALLATLAAELE
ncbi:MAG: DNA polymerase III subunit delta' [Deltaproteobacteria bacterium]|nr:DNA polymerase III subunit delta' [Deltaproteobacteria bacterium]